MQAKAMQNGDHRLKIGKTVSPTFVLAVILWYPLLHLKQRTRIKDFALMGWEICVRGGTAVSFLGLPWDTSRDGGVWFCARAVVLLAGTAEVSP